MNTEVAICRPVCRWRKYLQIRYDNIHVYIYMICISNYALAYIYNTVKCIDAILYNICILKDDGAFLSSIAVLERTMIFQP